MTQARRIPENVRDLYDLAREHGWTVEISNGNHLRWIDPDGNVVSHTSSTPSDWRAVKNLRKQLRAGGLPVPAHGYTPPKHKRGNAAVAATLDEPGAIVVELPLPEVLPADIEVTMREAMASDDAKFREHIYTLLRPVITYNEGTGVNAAEYWHAMQPMIELELDGETLAEITQSLYGQVRNKAHAESDSTDPADANRQLYTRSLRAPMVRALREALIAEDAQVTPDNILGYAQAAYMMLTSEFDGPALRLLQRADADHPAPTWSVAPFWDAPHDEEPPTETPEEKPMPITGTIITPKDTASPNYKPREEGDPLPWLCPQPDCGERRKSAQSLGGHTSHHKKADPLAGLVPEAPEAESTEVVVPEPVVEPKMFLGEPPKIESVEITLDPARVREAVRDALLDILVGGGNDVEDKARIAALEARVAELETEVETEHSDQVAAIAACTVVARERDEAVAALRLLLTDYINPKIVDGAIDTAKYLGSQ